MSTEHGEYICCWEVDSNLFLQRDSLENLYNTEMCASDWSPLKRNCKVGFFVGGGGTKQFVWALDKYVTKPQLGHSFSCGISLSLLPNVAKQVFSFLELVFYQQRWMKTDKKIWYFSWGKGGVEPNEKRVISWKSNLANGCKKNPLTFFASLRSFLFILLHYLKYTIFY